MPADRPAGEAEADRTRSRCATPVPANSEWDFYAKKNNNHMDPEAKPSAPAPQLRRRRFLRRNCTPLACALRPLGCKNVPTSVRFQPPKMLKGSVVLQIAAVTHESDALAMADVLQQKNFPAFVVTPSADKFYRVQVGPYRKSKRRNPPRARLTAPVSRPSSSAESNS